MLQGIIEDLYGRFVDVVYRSRKGVLSRAQVLTLADGRIFTADQAFRDRLIDRQAYLDEAIAGMKKQLGIKTARVVTYARPGQFRQTVYSEAVGGVARAGTTINLISFQGLAPRPGVAFMYLWNP